MIYEYLLGRLDTVEELQQQIYPVAVCIDDVAPPLAIYKFGGSDPVTDLGGEIHHIVETIDVVILSPDYEQLHRIGAAVMAAVTENSNLDTGYGEYLFSAECSEPEPEGFDPDIQMMSKTIRCTLRWCSLID